MNSFISGELTDGFDWKADYSALTGHFPNHTRTSPVIGITGNFGEKGCELAEGYFASIEAAGAIPFVLPPLTDDEVLLDVLDRVDGLLLSGGGDINPLFLGEEPVPALGGINPHRDHMELLLVRLAFDRQIPILGICRGIQVLAAALDGTVLQDLATALPDTELIKHDQKLDRGYASHTVVAEQDSLVEKLLGSCFAVNSFHHQAVGEAGPHLKVSARASDGVVEAIESNEGKSILGVQWHPECFLKVNNETMMPLFRWLRNEAVSFRKAVNLHEHIITLDSHCDTPMFFDQGVHFDQRDPKVLVDLHKMTEGHLDATIMVAYLEQKGRTSDELTAATAKANRILDEIEDMVNNCDPAVAIARTPDDLISLKAEGKKAVMMGIENGYAVGLDLDNVERFSRRGIVYMTLCHNGDNDICDSARRSEREHGGLSDFGRQVIAEMNRTGLMVDLSHASEESFYQALEVSETPIVCSHASARALCNHPRNLTDEQLRTLSEAGGVAQVTLYHGFLREEDKGEATLDDAVNHLLHMIDVAGIDHVGIGTDFDGDGGIPGCASASELINFTRRLQAEGLTDEDMEKVWGGNFLRIMRLCQSRSELI